MIYLYEDEEARYISEKTGCSLEHAYLYIHAEDDFLDTKGLIIYNGEKEHTSKHEDAPVIENDEIVAFIAETTGLNIELVDKMSIVELEYLEMKGLASEGVAC